MVNGVQPCVRRSKPFVWPVMLRSVQIETVSINGIRIYIEIARNRTSILWEYPPGSGVTEYQEIYTYIYHERDTRHVPAFVIDILA